MRSRAAAKLNFLRGLPVLSHEQVNSLAMGMPASGELSLRRRSWLPTLTTNIERAAEISVSASFARSRAAQTARRFFFLFPHFFLRPDTFKSIMSFLTNRLAKVDDTGINFSEATPSLVITDFLTELRAAPVIVRPSTDRANFKDLFF